MEKPTKKEIKEAMRDIEIVKKSCEEGIDGTWDCSTEEGRESFNDMVDLLERACTTINKIINSKK